MASKSKRRGRVFRASCILAALIIAGSSFAWFTSKDEVTNRLSASGDYDVSIVESFAPPANWLPNQKVNKDVYALNTGSIGAYVNEDVSGVLTYTVEKKVASIDDATVTLTEDEVDAIKAGAHLAGAFKADGTAMSEVEIGNKLDPATGDIYEYFNNGDETDPPTTDDYTPTVAGLYIFRRSIKVAGADDQTETFTYEGYYFDGAGKYYKLADLKINEKTSGKAGDNVKTDGNLSKMPTVMYGKEETKTVTPKLKFEAKEGLGTDNITTNHPNRLVAIVNTNGDGATNGAAVDSADKDVTGVNGKLKALNDAEAALNTAEAAYKAAQGVYNTAVTTIAYYAGSDNAESISTITVPTIITDAVEPGSAAKILESATDIVEPGILRGQIDEYNGLIDQFNALQSSINTANSTLTTASNTASTAQTTYDGAVSDFNTAKSTYNSTLGQDYDADLAAIGTPSTSDAIYTVWAKEQAMNEAKTALDNANSAKDAAQANVNSLVEQKENLRTKLKALGNTITTNVNNLNTAINSRTGSNDSAHGTGDADYTAKKLAYETALNAYNDALKAYNDARALYEANDNTETEIKIYINLSDDVVTTGNTTKDKWQLIPIVAGNDASDEIAHFYYTGILQGAESSAKLIDNVVLDKDTKQDAYKFFDFDLNVHLDSAQITYADDQTTLTTEAVVAEAGAFESRQANLTDPTDIETAVLWN